MTLKDHFARIRLADSPDALEWAMQEAWKEFPRPRTGDQIRRAAQGRGRELASASPFAHLVPQLGPRRMLRLCGKTYSVGYGGNSTGERYAWSYATTWIRETLLGTGLEPDVAERVISWWGSFPHRALRALVKSRAALGRGDQP